MLFPDEMITEPGTLRAVTLLASNTVTPPEGAPVLKVTVQVETAPLPKDAGVQLTELTRVGPNEIVAVCVLLL